MIDQLPLLDYDDIVGLDLNHPIRKRLAEQLAGIPFDKPRLPAGLEIYRRLPQAEPPLHVRTRMAAVMAQLVSASGCFTREDLLRAGFTASQIDEHHEAAARAARLHEMAV